MEKRTSAIARIVAALALVAAVVVLVAVVSGTTGGESSNTGGKQSTAHTKKHQKPPHRTTAKTYEIKYGDTLTSIAHKTGVPVAEIEKLNPEVDPQVLVAGEVLKLR
ncbi:MAG TPA: LysM peptidoglycan-binding domain-containing protein [Solirubrobacterales bacterium]